MDHYDITYMYLQKILQGQTETVKLTVAEITKSL